MKFLDMLTASDAGIKQTRALMLSDSTLLEVDTLIGNLKREVNQLKNSINLLTDLAPDNSYSLKPGGTDFKADEWVKTLHKNTLELKLKQIELDTALEIKSEWFSETIKA